MWEELIKKKNEEQNIKRQKNDSKVENRISLGKSESWKVLKERRNEEKKR